MEFSTPKKHSRSRSIQIESDEKQESGASILTQHFSNFSKKLLKTGDKEKQTDLEKENQMLKLTIDELVQKDKIQQEQIEKLQEFIKKNQKENCQEIVWDLVEIIANVEKK